MNEVCRTVALYGLKARREGMPVAMVLSRCVKDLSQQGLDLSFQEESLYSKPARKSVVRSTRSTSYILFSDAEDVSALSYWSTRSGKRMDQIEDYKVLIGLSKDILYMSMCEKIDNFDKMRKILIEGLLVDIEITYGIETKMPQSRGPSFHALGVGYGVGAMFGKPASIDDDNDERKRWFNLLPQGVVEQGQLRDIYEWNLLSSVHVKRNIDGLPLQAWIEAFPWRGNIESFGSHNFIWTISHDDLSRVREALMHETLLVPTPN